MYGYSYDRNKQVEINLGALFSVGFNKKYQKINIVNINHIENQIKVTFNRRLDNDDVAEFNERYGLDDDNKLEYIKYVLSINILENTFNLYLDFTPYYGISSLSKNEINNLIVQHLETTHFNLLPHFDLLITTLMEHPKTLNYWTYYWGSYGYEMGMANKNSNYNLDTSRCLRLNDYMTNNNPLTYDEDRLYYDCYKIYGSENDAKCIQVRRNFNSQKYANWKYCKVGTPINELN